MGDHSGGLDSPPGPVELVILTFPGERVDPATVDVLRDVSGKGDVTLLDIVFVTREPNGDLQVVEFDQGSETYGFDDIDVSGKDLANDEDIAVIADVLDPGTSAALIVYERTWIRRLSEAIDRSSGEVALQVRIPAEVAGDALRAADSGPR
ncbi:hypothetical protein CLV30_109111 [Haloactinopolyspora alba]|uniref:DUF1269 domain-containing protein n=1 Tax=Haloactinopolyspora alba TaxID=648780 RepID=A0A2P8DZZ8_9ACTN|nr:DUF6325 family protein [Haloactinopolyspora alba]PSL02803.1 hypothetical protein CLV30_109111 [Haloactinopolyspora alba]